MNYSHDSIFETAQKQKGAKTINQERKSSSSLSSVMEPSLNLEQQIPLWFWKPFTDRKPDRPYPFSPGNIIQDLTVHYRTHSSDNRVENEKNVREGSTIDWLALCCVSLWFLYSPNVICFSVSSSRSTEAWECGRTLFLSSLYKGYDNICRWEAV